MTPAATQALQWRGITPPKPGSIKTTCPQCSKHRTKPRERCLSVYQYSDRVAWRCWHCAWEDEEVIG